ncbi:MAG: hypothetical protein KAT20_03065 [Desulfuromonadales bacterium]|nr:hypothetical protein [Desulfuromonadales bacterium]NOQ51774.1 hypothetical protein [Desulfuromonadaceae bacterium]
MSDVHFADILLILIVCLVICMILSLVHRANKKASRDGVDPATDKIPSAQKESSESIDSE